MLILLVGVVTIIMSLQRHQRGAKAKISLSYIHVLVLLSSRYSLMTEQAL